MSDFLSVYFLLSIEQYTEPNQTCTFSQVQCMHVALDNLQVVDLIKHGLLYWDPLGEKAIHARKIKCSWKYVFCASACAVVHSLKK